MKEFKNLNKHRVVKISQMWINSPQLIGDFLMHIHLLQNNVPRESLRHHIFFVLEMDSIIFNLNANCRKMGYVNKN